MCASMRRQLNAVGYQPCDGIAVITMDNPPVNGLSHAVRLGLLAAFEQANSDASVQAIVLCGAGRAFSAGGDIRELGTPAASAGPGLSLHVHPVIESSRKPIVAALHGIAMGGGLETALACHYRVAAEDTRLALPEIKLGLMPLSGTQRLPRVLGLAAALDFILDAKTMLAREFLPGTLLDQQVAGEPEAVLRYAIEYARRASGVNAGQPELPLVRHRCIDVDAGDAAAVLNRARRRAIEIGPAAVAAVDAVAAAVEAADFDAGMTRARQLFDAVSASEDVHTQRGRFLAARSAEPPQ